MDLPVRDGCAQTLAATDWNFADASTEYATHGVHPYPAKFIPQIPRALILSAITPGQIVLDPFCGSGTTLVEALLAGRHCVGIDASPLACLISRAKTARLTPQGLAELRTLVSGVEGLAGSLAQANRTLPFNGYPAAVPRPPQECLDFWFEPHVVEELACGKALALAIRDEQAVDVALAAFSSIVVAVSKQDSDTRYVRRVKKVKPGDTLRRYARALSQNIDRCLEFSRTAEEGTTCRILCQDVLSKPRLNSVDLVVTSPPYPNAYSYHLYHRTRMLWLDMDPATYKKQEIGSHRKYSRKKPVDDLVQEFKHEMATLFEWLQTILRRGNLACFVIGDSTIGGRVIDNAALIAAVAAERGFALEGLYHRTIKKEKKSFNPAIGKIRFEKVVILRNGRCA